ncbi:MAG: xanthine dehydrogenase family protein molybdopterin-binding subunit [Thermoleophilia bacterium]
MSAVGENVRRSDGEGKVRGTAVYGIDHEEPHYLHAKVFRSWLPAGRIVRLDTTKAEQIPGVYAVVTAKDAPHLHGFACHDQPLFATDVIRYEGEPIAAVAAETWNQARAALKAIEIEIEPIEPVSTVEDSLAEGARLVHENWEAYTEAFPLVRSGNVAAEATMERGDVEAAFAKADLVVEDVFRTPRQHQSYIEPRVAVARYEEGRYVVHTSTQWPFNTREGTAAYLGVRPSAVRVIVPTVGGGFGGKLVAGLEPIACLLARKSGRPVKLVNTRREEFLAGNPRDNCSIRVRTALTKDGEILAQESDTLIDNGAYGGEMPLVAGIPALLLPTNYRMGAMRMRSRLLYTNTPPTGAFRGVTGTSLNFALERHVDNCANALGMDRREFRLRNCYRDGDLGPTGQVLEETGFVQALEELERVAPWAEASAKRPYRGVGMALLLWPTNPMPGGMTLKLNEDGTVGIVSAAIEIGTGAMTQGVTQIVADELGVRPEDVVLLKPDTDVAAYDAGAQGGRTLFGAGNAARVAAEDVRTQVFATAAGLLEADAGDLELVDGHVQVKGAPDRRVPLATVAVTALWTAGPIQGTGKFIAPPIPYEQGCIVGSVFTAINAGSWNAHLCEVEVDPDTGKVTILRYVVVQDVGKAINPKAIESQIQGGVVQGVGYALFEELRLQDGVCQDTGFTSYRLPTALDAPAVESIVIEVPSPVGPLGAKGAAEAPIVPVAAAIANAVSDAIGKPMNEIPMTPFAVLAAIHGDGNGAG